METYTNLILVVVCVWLLSLSVTLLRFSHIVVQYPLMAEWYSNVDIEKFDYAFTIDGHLGCF